MLKSQTDYVLDIAVLGLPHISNFDDFDPLKREPGVRLRYVEDRDALGKPDLIVLPGTKTTMADLWWLRERGFAADIQRQADAGTPVIGICGGYQMLGRTLNDPDHVESSLTSMEGLGLLPLNTVFQGSKETHRIKGQIVEAVGLLAGAAGLPVQGYEIHMGRTTGEGVAAPVRIDERADVPVAAAGSLDGAVNAAGDVLGTYVHGLFQNTGLRRAILNELARRKGVSLPETTVELDLDREYDRLADWVRSSLDMELVYRLAGLSRDFERTSANW
jgi:adenosylcobyric acid synthase